MTHGTKAQAPARDETSVLDTRQRRDNVRTRSGPACERSQLSPDRLLRFRRLPFSAGASDQKIPASRETDRDRGAFADGDLPGSAAVHAEYAAQMSTSTRTGLLLGRGTSCRGSTEPKTRADELNDGDLIEVAAYG